MITKELKELVVKEAVNLKKYATERERARLDFEALRPGEADLCIYGQMTFNCFSLRALELLQDCAVPYSREIGYFLTPNCDFSINSERPFSPIEYYIYQSDAQNKNLIDFLKGDIETLTINEL